MCQSLQRSQDANPDRGGVSRVYSARHHKHQDLALCTSRSPRGKLPFNPIVVGFITIG